MLANLYLIKVSQPAMVRFFRFHSVRDVLVCSKHDENQWAFGFFAQIGPVGTRYFIFENKLDVTLKPNTHTPLHKCPPERIRTGDIWGANPWPASQLRGTVQDISCFPQVLKVLE